MFFLHSHAKLPLVRTLSIIRSRFCELTSFNRVLSCKLILRHANRQVVTKDINIKSHTVLQINTPIYDATLHITL